MEFEPTGRLEHTLRSCVGRDWDYKIHGYHFRGPVRRFAITQSASENEKSVTKLEIFLDWQAGREKGVWFLDNSPETNPYHDKENGCFSISFKLDELALEEDADGNLHISAPTIQQGIIHKSGESLELSSLKSAADVF